MHFNFRSFSNFSSLRHFHSSSIFRSFSSISNLSSNFSCLSNFISLSDFSSFSNFHSLIYFCSFFVFQIFPFPILPFLCQVEPLKNAYLSFLHCLFFFQGDFVAEGTPASQHRSTDGGHHAGEQVGIKILSVDDVNRIVRSQGFLGRLDT